MTRTKTWWSLVLPDVGLLGTGWLVTQQVPRWNGGAAHWPIMFQTRRRARQECQALREKYREQGWKFQVVRLAITYVTSRP